MDAKLRKAVDMIGRELRYSRQLDDEEGEDASPRARRGRGGPRDDDTEGGRRTGRDTAGGNRGRRGRDMEDEETRGTKKQQGRDKRPRERIHGNAEAFPEL
jgi:hypothetical protein